MEDYTEYSLHRLHKALTKAEKEEDDHDETTPEAGQEAAHKQQGVVIRQKVKTIDKEIARREKEEANAKAATIQPQTKAVQGGGGGLNTGQLNMRIKLVENAISELNTFGSGCEVSTFVRDVKNKVHLANCATSKEYMLERLVTRLSPEYQTRYFTNTQTTPIKTIDSFLEYVKETYTSCKSIFQYFESIDNFERGTEDGSIRDYASRVRNEIFEIETIIDSKYKVVANKKDPSADGVLGKTGVYKLLTGMVVLRSLKQDRELYNHVISRIDDCLDGDEIANIAEAFYERKQTDDPLLSKLAPSVNYVNKRGKGKGGPKSNTDKLPCFKFFDGNCNNDNCSFAHRKITQSEADGFGYQKWKKMVTKNAKKKSKADATEEKEPDLGAAFVHGGQGFRY